MTVGNFFLCKIGEKLKRKKKGFGGEIAGERKKKGQMGFKMRRRVFGGEKFAEITEKNGEKGR